MPGAETDPTLIAAMRLERRFGPSPHRWRVSQSDSAPGGPAFAPDLACEALHQFRFGILVVGTEARVLLANRAAEAMLADSRGALCVERQRLTARRQTDCAALSRLIGVAVRHGSGGSLAIAHEGCPTLIVLVMPLAAPPGTARRPELAIVLVRYLEQPGKQSSGAFARHFSLTCAQTALANEIVRGDGVRAAARRLRISYGTARAHLLQIFQKTGVRRQTALVRLMSDWDDGINQLADAVSGRASLPERGR